MENEKNPVIFVVGNSRSGTTMMGRIIGMHPKVFTFGELHFFGQLWSATDKDRSLSGEQALNLLKRLFTIQRDGYLRQGNPRRFKEEARTVLDSIEQRESMRSLDVFRAFLDYETRRNSKTIPCDQTPRNVYYIGDILELIPEARIVNMVRDPRDVLLSQKKKWKRRFLGGKYIPLQEAFRAWVNYHPITISKMWNAAINSADKYRDHQRIFQLRFEDLINRPEESIHSVVDFLGLQFSENMLELPQIGSSSGNDHPERKGINKNAAGRWQKGGLSPAEIAICTKVTTDTMKKHGYQPTEHKRPIFKMLKSYLIFPVKLGFAFMFNVKRMRNLKDTIRRRLSA
ncbi:hypothetical protein GF337_08520 [candidate division KSB1 bacterium]|nr:hypothetical protein [candidate division KSB1 bacterium]